MPSAFKIARYGWRPSHPDHRDLKLQLPALRAPLPPVVDLRSGIGPSYDQGQLGSCTGNALAGMGQFLLKKCGKPVFTPSRLFIYWNEREMEGTVDQDAGAMIRDGMKVVTTLGCPPESDWPYVESQFTVKPPAVAYQAGLQHRISQYLSVDNTNTVLMKSQLASGIPIVGGFSVYESFESPHVAATGMVPMPQPNEQMVGGHAILVVGYNDHLQFGNGVVGGYTVRNSWGPTWGDHGAFHIPYLYFSNPNLASDFWTSHTIS